MVSRGPDQRESRPDNPIPQARFAHGAVRVPSTALDHGKVSCASIHITSTKIAAKHCAVIGVRHLVLAVL